MGDVPRPPEATPLRRVLEQVTMWVVLVATIGAAAWVSAGVNALGSPQTFDGITIQLPKRWVPTADQDGETVIELRERGDPTLARTLTIRRASLSLRSLFRAAPKRTEQVTLAGGVVAKISVVANRVASDPRVGTVSELEVVTVFTPPGGNALAISIQQISFKERVDAEQNVALMKRILETVEFTGAS